MCRSRGFCPGTGQNPHFPYSPYLSANLTCGTAERHAGRSLRSFSFLQPKNMQAQRTDGGHDDTRQDHAQTHRAGGGLPAHVQKARGQGAGPGSGTGQGDAHEQQQGDEQPTAAGGGDQLLTGLLALVQDLGEQTADVGLGAAL